MTFVNSQANAKKCIFLCICLVTYKITRAHYLLMHAIKVGSEIGMGWMSDLHIRGCGCGFLTSTSADADVKANVDVEVNENTTKIFFYYLN